MYILVYTSIYIQDDTGAVRRGILVRIPVPVFWGVPVGWGFVGWYVQQFEQLTIRCSHVKGYFGRFMFVFEA